MDVTASPYVFYFVAATDFSGNEGRPAKVNTLSGVGGTPTSYVLSVSNHPNPFNPRTTVSYTVPSRGPVTIAIYDARGARVATLVDNEERDAGAYRTEWNGQTDTGATVSSGVYFARIEQNGATRTRKMVLLK
jgi:flagellar hook assembly protein FlgD